MSIADTMRKALSLVVELPPEEKAAYPFPSRQKTGSDETNENAPRNSAAAAVAAALAAGNEDATPAASETVEARPFPSPVNNSLDGLMASPPAPKTVEQIVRESDGPNLDEIAAQLPSAAGALKSDGTLDFAALYQAAHLPPSPFTAEQTVDMLNSLPQTLPLDVKRQTVQVTLSAMGKAIGATPETIVADTSRKLAALAAYSDNAAQSANAYSEETEKEIAALLAQAEEKRAAIAAARAQQTAITEQCSREADRLDDVLEFFSLDVFPSRLATNAGATPTTHAPSP